jgi:hypothetical protein
VGFSDPSRDTPLTAPSCRGGNRESSLLCYSGFVDKIAQQIGSSRTERIASLSFEELAAQQGVTPVDDFETLLGSRSPEDESAEDFSASLREWRREGNCPANPQ